MGQVCSDCYGPSYPGGWHGGVSVPSQGQYQISNIPPMPAANGQSYGSTIPQPKVAVDPLTAIQVGPDPMPHVASNFHSVLPRTDVEQHFTRTHSVTIAGTKKPEANNSTTMTKSKTSTTIFGPQDDDAFNKSKYPAAAPPTPTASLYEAPNPAQLRSANFGYSPTRNSIPGVPPGLVNRPSAYFQQMPPPGFPTSSFRA